MKTAPPQRGAVFVAPAGSDLEQDVQHVAEAAVSICIACKKVMLNRLKVAMPAGCRLTCASAWR
jgi:hypothetical protein